MTKKRYCWFVAFILMLAACFGLAACADPSDHSETGAEAGEYYCSMSGKILRVHML